MRELKRLETIPVEVSMSKRIIIIASIVSLLAACTQHQTTNNIVACDVQNVSYQKQDLILNSAYSQPKETIYIFQNISDHSFWLNHASTKGMSAGWGSSIAPNHYSAILMNTPNFSFSCTQDMGNQIQKLDCQKAVRVCKFKTIQQTSSQDHYWIVEDKSQTEVVTEIRRRGF
jgi:hypothetical protein